MKKFLLLLILFVKPDIGRSQIAWEYFSSDTTSDYAQKIVECHDGNFLLASLVHSNNQWELAVKKISINGSVLWEKYFIRPPSFEVFGLIDLPSDNAIVFLDRNDIPAYECFKVSRNGDSLSSVLHTFNNVNTVSGGIPRLSPSGFIYTFVNVSGVSPFGDPFAGFSLAKLDTNGILLPFQVSGYYGSSCGLQPVLGSSVAITSNDKLWFSYYRPFVSPYCAPYLALEAFTGAGDSLFTYHNIDYGWFGQVVNTFDDGCLVRKSNSSLTDSILKFSSQGNVQWTLDITGQPGIILQTLDGNCIVGSNGFELRKIQLYEGQVWDHLLNADAQSKLSDVIQASDSGYALIGTRYNSSLNFNQIYVLKTPADRVLGIDEIPLQTNLKLLLTPNPSPGKFTVALDNKAYFANLRIKIFDVTGREAEGISVQATSTRVFQVEAQNISPGMYVIQILEGRQIIATAKWIKD